MYYLVNMHLQEQWKSTSGNQFLQLLRLFNSFADVRTEADALKMSLKVDAEYDINQRNMYEAVQPRYQ